MVQGKNLLLSVNNETIAAAKTCALDLNTDFLETSSPTEGDWRDYLPTIKSWGCSADALCASMDYFDQLEKIWHNGTKVTLRFWDSEMGCFYKGYAYIKNLHTTGQVGSTVTMSVTFQPTGELQRAIKTEIQISNSETAIDTYYLFWPETGRKYVFIREDDNENILYVERTFTTMTRIDALHKIIVCKGTATTVLGYIEAQATQNLNNAAVLYARTDEDAHTVVPPGTYTFLLNDSDVVQAPQLWVMPAI